MMIKRVNLLILSCYLLFPFFVTKGYAVEESKMVTVAFSEFQTQSDASDKQWIGANCIDAITAKIAGQKSIKMIERQYLSKIIEEQKLQASGLVDDNSIVELGNLLAVNYFIFGSATVLSENLVLRARIVSVESSQVKAAVEANGTLNDIFRLQNELAQKIASSLYLGELNVSANDAANTGQVSFQAAGKLEKIKKLAEPLPFFTLDPARKRKTSEYTLALNMCDDLLEKYPALQKAHYYKGLFSIQAEDYATADVETKEAKNLNTDDVDAFVTRAFYFFVTEKYNEAKQTLTFASSKFPNDSRVWYALSKIHMAENNSVSAIENLITALNNQPYLPNAETNLRALTGAESISLGQFSAKKYFNIATLYKVMYGTGGALNKNVYELAKETNEMAPGFAISYYMMGLFEKNQGVLKAAETNLYASIKLKPTFAEAHREIGTLYLLTGNCAIGKQHINLYLQSSNAVQDYGELQTKINRCH